MQGSNQAYARQERACEEATLSFKRFILTETAAFESTPEADLFRVNTLAQMLDRFDDYVENGADTPSAITYVKREFSDLAQRMREEGFSVVDANEGNASRWPLMTEDEAAQYLKEANAQVHKRAIGIGMLSACCLPLMLLCGFETLVYGYTGDVGSLLGLCGMFGMIAMGVYAIVTAKKPDSEKQIKKKRFSLSARLHKKLTALKEMTHEKARRRRGRGIAMLVACVLPILLGAAFDELLPFYTDAGAILGVGGMFAMIGAGVYELIVADGEKKAIDKLLKG